MTEKQAQLCFKSPCYGARLNRGDTLRRLTVALQVSPDEIIDWQIFEDKNVLTMLSLSQLGFGLSITWDYYTFSCK